MLRDKSSFDVFFKLPPVKMLCPASWIKKVLIFRWKCLFSQLRGHVRRITHNRPCNELIFGWICTIPAHQDCNVLHIIWTILYWPYNIVYILFIILYGLWVNVYIFERKRNQHSMLVMGVLRRILTSKRRQWWVLRWDSLFIFCHYRRFDVRVLRKTPIINIECWFRFLSKIYTLTNKT